MFNPDGVKGKTAQPHHNFFKIMQNKSFAVTFIVKDDATQIELYKLTEYTEARCRCVAIRKATKAALDYIERQWRFEAFSKYLPKYGITAKQLWAMVDDGLIPIPNDKVVEVYKCRAL